MTKSADRKPARQTKGATKMIVKLNARALATQAWARKSALMLRPSGVEPTPLKQMLEAATAHLEQVAEQMDIVSKTLHGAADAGWSPAKLGAASKYSVGDYVVLVPARREKLERSGAYDPTALAKLTVQGIHGQQVKLFTSTGEGLGLVPAKWIAPAAETNRRARG